MPTRIPIYRDDIFARMDRNKAELKKEINDVALLILARIGEKVEAPEVNKPIKKKK